MTAANFGFFALALLGYGLLVIGGINLHKNRPTSIACVFVGVLVMWLGCFP